MIDLVSSLSAREADLKTVSSGVSAELLMRRVAEGILENARFKQGRTLIVSGKGGNGGDGYALYLLMKENGFSVSITDFGESKSAAASFYRNKCENEILPYSEELSFDSYQNIVDCLFGVGLTRPIAGEFLSCVKKINRSGAYVVSVDIPSGISSDDGRTLGEAVNANVTFAVQNMKLGHFLSDGLDCSGEIGVLDVGIEKTAPDCLLVEDQDVARLFPPLKRNVHKGSRGFLSIIAGSDLYSGAAVLAEMGAEALAFGDGLVRLCVPESILYSVMNKITECTLLPMPSRDGSLLFSVEYLRRAIDRATAVLFGNGVSLSEGASKMLSFLIENVTVPLVLDADALNLLSSDPSLLTKRVGQTVLTPHPKEMSRLMGIPTDEILSDPLSYAKEFAARYKVIVLLKGASTIVTDGKIAYLSASGSPGMAKGGSGDVLAGAVAALLAQGKGVLESAYGAAYVLGLAGEISAKEVGVYSMLPSDTARNVSAAIRYLSKFAE